MAKDCNDKEIKLLSEVILLKNERKAEVRRIDGDRVFIVFMDDNLPACGDYNDYNLKVV